MTIQLEQTIIDIIDKVSSVLSDEKAYNIDGVCLKYDISIKEAYSSPESKQKYIYGNLINKDPKFILELARKVTEDYKSDQLGLSLNNYYSGKFYKLSLVTRRELLAELFTNSNLAGLLSKEEFLQTCGFQIPNDFDFDMLFNGIFGAKKQLSSKKEPSLIEVLEKNRIHEVLDEKFFRFLEQIVHPYTRSNKEAVVYLDLINKYLRKDNLHLTPDGEISGEIIYRVGSIAGVSDTVKNLIFASNGFKPEIVLDDALSNKIKIVRNEQNCLVYERPIKRTGLLWIDLVDWWSAKNNVAVSKEQAANLKKRLDQSLASPPERLLFDTYYNEFSKRFKRGLPALIPQIYLHYDPYSIKKHGIQYLLRQRMDFLILLSNNIRVVIEVDGKQHYSDENTAAPAKYAEMVSLDRELKLLGYDVYRFGGYELQPGFEQKVISFFEKLFEKYRIQP
jgi:very-short-patch-repair endonuclease